jgi:hypothetical protein
MKKRINNINNKAIKFIISLSTPCILKIVLLKSKQYNLRTNWKQHFLDNFVFILFV